MSRSSTFDVAVIGVGAMGSAACFHLARRALARVFGREPVLVREGLSIPAAVSIQQELHVPVVLTGLGLPDCRAHGPDETFPVAHLANGRELFPVLLEELFPGGPDRAG